MRNIIASICLLIFCIISGYTQENEIPFSIGIGGGIDLIRNKDLAASPLPYNGFGLPLGLNVFSRSNYWIHHFEVSVIIPLITNNYALKSKVNTQLKNWTKINVKYSLLKNINHNHYLGGTIKSDFFLREYHFLDGMSWDWSNSLNVTYAHRISVSKKVNLLPQISIPLLAYIHRKPSLTFDEQFLDDVTYRGVNELTKYGQWNIIFDKWFAVDFDILFNIDFSNKFSFQSRIGINYYTIKYPERITNINMPIRCYLNYKF